MTIVIDRATIDSKVKEFLESPFLLYRAYHEIVDRINAKNENPPTNSDLNPTFFEKYRTALLALQDKGSQEPTKKGDVLDTMINGYIGPVLEGINKFREYISDDDLKSLRYKAVLDGYLAYSLGIRKTTLNTSDKRGFWRNPVTWFGAITFAALTYVTGLYLHIREDMQNMYNENFAKVQLEIEQGKKYMEEQREAVKIDLQKIVDDGLKEGDMILEQRIDEGVRKIEDATSFNPFRKK